MPTLHWLNDEEARKQSGQLPYRLLEADPKLSHGDSETENMLIQGDNLEALKALLPYYAGQVKCIYIDPPYNTQSAFEHYDDNLEHAIWLSTIYPRLEILRDLLSDDGSLWVTIDDNESHYLKIVMDEIFGRKNFIANIAWRTSDSSNNNVTKFSQDHNDIFVYSKKNNWRPKFLNDPSKRKHFKNPDDDPRGPWFDGNNLQNPGLRPNLQFDITAPNGHVIKHPPNGWRWSKETIVEKMETGEIRFSKDGTRLIRRTYLADMEGLPPSTLWVELEDTGHNRQAKYELKNLFPESKVTDLFSTPKPERLLKHIFNISTNEGDLVLDSFLGSGTTAAVAHKMGRRYIGIEMGDHAVTFCIPRLKKVVEGEQGGISKEVNWQGGGGFHFYRLGETVFDEHGHINEKVKFKALAAHVWFSETHTPLSHVVASRTLAKQPPSRKLEIASRQKAPLAMTSPLLGIHNETAYYLLYNGILGDTDPKGGNVLTSRVLRQLPKHKGKKVIYGEMSMLEANVLRDEEITFKHIPYDIKAR